MKKVRDFFRITPFKLSLLIVAISISASFLYDTNPSSFPAMSALDQKSLDLKFSFRGNEKAKSKIVIVAGDEKSFQTFGQWPWDRANVFANLIDRLCSYNPAVIGLDLVWSEKEKMLSPKLRSSLEASAIKDSLDQIIKDNSGDVILGSSIEACKQKLVLGYALSLDEGLSKPEYEARLKTLTEGASNTLTHISKGEAKYAKFENDSSANVQFYHYAETGLLNIPEITPPGIAQGFFNNVNDSDGNYRNAIMFFRTDAGFVSSLALRMAQKLQASSDAPPTLLVQPFIPEKNQSEELSLSLITKNNEITRYPLDLTGKTIVNYRGPNKTFPYVSISDLLSNDDQIEISTFVANKGVVKSKVSKKDFFQDAAVLIGITATGLYDIRPRPLDSLAAGVENHANILDNVLNNDFILRPTTELLLTLLLIIFVVSLTYGYVIARVNANWGAVIAFISIFTMLVVDQKLLFEKGVHFSGYAQAIQFLFQYIAITALKYMREEKEKKFIRSAFDKYVSPSVVNEMLSDPTKLRLGGEKKEISILFSDIRGFTELSEKVEVKTLSQFLNEYLGDMTEILQTNKGTLDKYIGDAVMGFWGAPIEVKSQADLAVTTAVQMIEKLVFLNELFQSKYGFKIDIGIGINTGPVSVGNFGSSKVFEYTVIGDNVNLASRLEGLNKPYGTKILISQFTYEKLTPNLFLTREIDNVKVKGKNKSVKIFEVFPNNADFAPIRASLNIYNAALDHYYKRNWSESVNLFQQVLKQKTDDRVSAQMIERCQYFTANPPPNDWDGSWEMKTK